MLLSEKRFVNERKLMDKLIFRLSLLFAVHNSSFISLTNMQHVQNETIIAKGRARFSYREDDRNTAQ